MVLQLLLSENAQIMAKEATKSGPELQDCPEIPILTLVYVATTNDNTSNT